MGTQSFLHHGHMGDVILSLASVKHLGGGTYYLMPDCFQPPMRQFTVNEAIMMRDFLRTQPYIDQADLYEGQPIEFNFGPLRENPLIFEQHLVLSHWETIKGKEQPPDSSEPWIEAEPRRVAEVIVARSNRINREECDEKYKEVIDSHDCCFMGFPDEHKDFCQRIGDIPMCPLMDVIYMAQAIAGADMFVGNQTLAFALAESMKKKRILETCPEQKTCLPLVDEEDNFVLWD